MKTETRYIMALVKGTLIAIIACVVFSSFQSAKEADGRTPDVVRELPKGSPSLVIQKCETSEPGVFPKAVVLQRTGGGAYITRNQKAIDRALDTALDGVVWDEMQVLKFCK